MNSSEDKRTLSKADDTLKQMSRNLKKRKVRLSFLRSLFVFVILLYLLFGFVFEIEIVHGDSMKNTLKNGDVALSLRNCKEYSVGDIVILKTNEKSDYVKRIVALPGDTVDIDPASGSLIRNGKTVSEPYALGKTLPKDNGVTFPITLAVDEYFALGDNRPVSLDSRFFGPVPSTQIKAKLIWPSRSDYAISSPLES